MDSVVAARLDSRRNNPHYDARLKTNVENTARDYLQNGILFLNTRVMDLDAASDIVNMMQPTVDATAFAQMDRTSALAWRHPAAFTQLVVLTTAIAEILYGAKQARSVEAQGEDDETKADDINHLLSWNDAKIKLYLQGWLHTWSAVVFNRGIWHERPGQDVDTVREPVMEDDITKPMVPLFRKDGKPRLRQDGTPIMGYPKRQRMRNKTIYSGFHNAVDLVSPYDFICDPSLPVVRMNEWRYCGHRIMIPWHELKRRSELNPEDPQYVLPGPVYKAKNYRQNAVVPASFNGATGLNSTYTYWARQQGYVGSTSFQSIAGNGVGSITGSDGVNKDDGGTIECFCLYLRARPKDLLLYDDEEFEIINILTTSAGDVLSINVMPNKHNQFPYAVAEILPDAFKQFTPGFGLRTKPVQDRIDYLNGKHAQALARMGVILGVDAAKGDVANLLSPDKMGLLIQKKAEGASSNWDEVVKQIDIKDPTTKFPEEMEYWKNAMEAMTGANAYAQGMSEDPEQTLGQFDATRQMALGRISSMARMLSEQALMPQTDRFVQNLQQFMSDQQKVRVLGKADYDPLRPEPRYKVINKTDIQGKFDVVPHDGSLPGADSKIVAAAARTLEAYAQNPQLAEAFNDTVPGSINILKVLRDLLKKSGLPVEKYSVSLEEAQRNLMQKQQAAGMFGQQMPGQQPAPANGSAPPTPPMIQTPNGGIPSAGQLPENPTAAPPMLNGRTT